MSCYSIYIFCFFRNSKTASAEKNNFDNPTRRVMQRTALRTGYLHMKCCGIAGREGNDMHTLMKKKFFALFDHLQYYENESSYLAKENPEGIIKLDVYYVVKCENANEEERTHSEFTVYSYNPCIIEYTMRVQNADECDAWVATLSSFPSMI